MHPEKEGFEIIAKNPDFKCAFITASEQYKFGKIRILKRHNDTDEVFVLLSGSAVLFTRDDSDKKAQITPLLQKTAYRVTSGTWHHLAVSADAVVFVAESGSMKAENTQSINVESEDLFI